MAEHFTTVAEGGPLGAGRLSNDPNLQVLDELIAAAGDPSRSPADQRGASQAFDKFSSFLERQDAKQAIRQAGQRQAEAQELTLQEKRDEASFRKEALKDPATKRAMNAFRRASLILGGPRNVPQKFREQTIGVATPQAGLPKRLIDAVNRPPEEFAAIVRDHLNKGNKLPRQAFTALFNANQKADAARRQEATREQATGRAEERTPEARREQSFAFIENELGRPLNSEEKIGLSNATTAKDVVQRLSEEAEAKATGAPDQPFAQSPDQSATDRSAITPEEVADFLRKAGGDRGKARSLAREAGKTF